MFNNAITEHKNKLKTRRKEFTLLKRNLAKEMNNNIKESLSPIYNELDDIYSNQALLNEKILKLNEKTMKFAQETQHYTQLYIQLNDDIKQLGNIKEWAITTDNNCKFIANILDNIVSNKTKTLINKKK